MFHKATIAHQQARFMRPDAARFIRPDAARFLKPGTGVEDVFPALATKYSPNQPRVPAGSGRDSGRWTDGEGAATPINDPRVVSDADPEVVRPGEQYAQARGGSRSTNVVRINGQNIPLTPGQSARLEVARARAEDAAARVLEVDRNWKPQPSAFQTPDGLIRAYESDAVQAQARMNELAAQRLAPGPFTGESVVSSGGSRPTAAERETINRIGRETGCHSCGTKDSGRPDGNFTPDNQPPTALNWSSRLQLLLPHCATCSAKQGSAVRDFLGRRR